MMTNDTAKWMELLASAGFLYGPFFFSLLFILVVTRTAHSYYKTACERVTPPVSPEEKKTYQMYFMASTIVGIMLVFIAVAWWVYAQLQTHTLEGVIAGLNTNQTIIMVEDDIYLRAIEKEVGSGHKRKDYHFVIVRDNPFIIGQTFRLGFFPEPGSIGAQEPKPIELVVKYSGRSRERLKILKSGDAFILTHAD